MPVVFTDKAARPIAVLLEAVVFADKAAEPMAVLLSPLSEPSSNAVLPSATLFEPVG